MPSFARSDEATAPKACERLTAKTRGCPRRAYHGIERGFAGKTERTQVMSIKFTGSDGPACPG